MPIFKFLEQAFKTFGAIFPDIKIQRYILIVSIIGFPLLFWFIESQTKIIFFWYLQRKVSILTSLIELNKELALNYEDLNKELVGAYTKILLELDSQNYVYLPERLLRIFNTIKMFSVGMWESMKFKKFISGASICYLFMVYELFKSREESQGSTILSAFALGSIFGGIGVMIPMILHPLVNYFLYPVIQFIGLSIVGRRSSKASI